MSQLIFIAKETARDEVRVAASPDTVKRYVDAGFEVVVEKGAGISSHISDDEFAASGAVIGSASHAKRADVILKVQRPGLKELKNYKKNAVLLAILEPFDSGKEMLAIAKSGVSAFAMELMPRITRAQSMDVLSSQANLAGYQAVMDAAYAYGHVFPMMMTAAGTIPPARVFVMGAGVAGLQAIATARRLGAVVSATDVRPAVKEQVMSLGAKFIAVENEEFRAAETSGGYAKEMSAEYQTEQSALVSSHIAKQNIIVTTALIPGRPAPRLVTKQMLKTMSGGAVIVDLAVERGGNVEGAVAGKTVEIEGVKIVGHRNFPGRVAASASKLYAKNLAIFLTELTDEKTSKVDFSVEDELVNATLVTHGGKIVQDRFAAQVNSTPEKSRKA